MNVQNVDLSQLSVEKDKQPLPKWLKIVLVSVFLLFILIFLAYYFLSPAETDIDVRPQPTPILEVTPTVPVVPEDRAELELIRRMWFQAREDLKANNYDDELLQPPHIDLELELDE